MKQPLVGSTREELEAIAVDLGEKPFRGRQLYKGIYEGAVDEIAAMTDLPKRFRERLEAQYQLVPLTLASEQRSKDGTVKRLYRLHDGQLIESVLMPYADGRRTACISSQAGCAMGCVFCATGQMGFARHLTKAEIVSQAWLAHVECRADDARLSNVVMMGMGEPLHNYDPVLASVRALTGDFGIGARHITLSTVGLAPQIERFADEGLQVTLAVSLHASDDAARGALMPVNRKYDLARLMTAVRTYFDRTGRRVTFEWALIAGENDDEATAEGLGRLLRGLTCHVNLIPLNPTGGYAGRPSDPGAVERFIAVLGRYGVPATIRVRRGIDIDAGCGQLKSKVQRTLRPARG